MTYERLADFVKNRMRMSHVYQPVMLMTLLRAGGRSSTGEIARSILAHDESQVEYYQDVTKNMVGRVLRGHEIVKMDAVGRSHGARCRSIFGRETSGGWRWKKRSTM